MINILPRPGPSEANKEYYLIGRSGSYASEVKGDANIKAGGGPYFLGTADSLVVSSRSSSEPVTVVQNLDKPIRVPVVHPDWFIYG